MAAIEKIVAEATFEVIRVNATPIKRIMAAAAAEVAGSKAAIDHVVEAVAGASGFSCGAEIQVLDVVGQGE